MRLDINGNTWPRYHVLDAAGDIHQTDRETWQAFLVSPQRILADDVIGGVTRVSTIFVGINRERFQSLIQGGPDNGHTFNYESRTEALEGHKRLVEILSSIVTGEP
jgi:hypothetical protein